MSKFKVGDKVKIVDRGIVSLGSVGKVGTISEVDQDLQLPYLVIFDNHNLTQEWFSAASLESINSKTPDPKTDDASNHLELDPYKKLAQDILYRYSSNCSHSWKQYLGFNDSFEYCEHCDARKGEI